MNHFRDLDYQQDFTGTNSASSIQSLTFTESLRSNTQPEANMASKIHFQKSIECSQPAMLNQQELDHAMEAFNGANLSETPENFVVVNETFKKTSNAVDEAGACDSADTCEPSKTCDSLNTLTTSDCCDTSGIGTASDISEWLDNQSNLNASEQLDVCNGSNKEAESQNSNSQIPKLPEREIMNVKEKISHGIDIKMLSSIRQTTASQSIMQKNRVIDSDKNKNVGAPRSGKGSEKCITTPLTEFSSSTVPVTTTETSSSDVNRKNPSCICDRPICHVLCLGCRKYFQGHAVRTCPDHPRRINLMDIAVCPNINCRGTELQERSSTPSPVQDMENESNLEKVTNEEEQRYQQDAKMGKLA